ncbi:hypothetical protein [Bradyrhizobium sp. OK095]|uniref:hypothetical protein n=1 Tax=Bradyrhizobium sp. OK095 TaxID=1882760 RepID=UPI00115FC802|nr:hypothetical protein [Bradyrhizobium sp. OK095]
MTAVRISRAHRAQERLEPCRCSSIVAFNKDAFPTASIYRQRTHSYRLPKQAQLCCVSLQAQYLAFVHVAVGKQRSSNRHRAQQDLRLGTFISKALAREPGFHP